MHVKASLVSLTLVITAAVLLSTVARCYGLLHGFLTTMRVLCIALAVWCLHGWWLRAVG